MAEIRFRAATPADDAFFVEMEFHTTWESLDPEDKERLHPEAVRSALQDTHQLLLNRPGNQLIVAVDERGTRLGLLWFGVNRNLVTGEDEAWVYNVSVVREHQGRGVGRQLMQHAEQVARNAGYPILGLMVSSHNYRARSLYEKLGFRPTNVLMRKRLGEES